jgi:hypothetical protein
MGNAELVKISGLVTQGLVVHLHFLVLRGCRTSIHRAGLAPCRSGVLTNLVGWRPARGPGLFLLKLSLPVVISPTFHNNCSSKPVVLI